MEPIDQAAIEWLEAESREPLCGSEPFKGISANVEDFWAFAIPDLRMNNVRGWLAEFFVAKAVGIEKPTRIEWDSVDVLWGDIGIEVKSSAYLQVWKQKNHSKLIFSGLKSRLQNEDQGTYVPERTYHADVYVFCVNTAKTHSEYNPLDLDQWSFAVLPRKTLKDMGYASLSWTTVLAKSSGALAFSDLAEAITEAAKLNSDE